MKWYSCGIIIVILCFVLTTSIEARGGGGGSEGGGSGGGGSGRRSSSGSISSGSIGHRSSAGRSVSGDSPGYFSRSYHSSEIISNPNLNRANDKNSYGSKTAAKSGLHNFMPASATGNFLSYGTNNLERFTRSSDISASDNNSTQSKDSNSLQDLLDELEKPTSLSSFMERISNIDFNKPALDAINVAVGKTKLENSGATTEIPRQSTISNTLQDLLDEVEKPINTKENIFTFLDRMSKFDLRKEAQDALNLAEETRKIINSETTIA